ncbi:MAG: tetratricopeptide repeat protein [Pseudomonadota bacterium]
MREQDRRGAKRGLSARTGPAFAIALVAGLAAPVAAVADTLTGAYLAARQAMRQNDSAAAAHYFERAARLRPREGAFRERATFYRVSNGDVTLAERYARQLFDMAPDNRIAQLVLAQKAIREGRTEEAKGFIEGEGQGSAGRLLRTLLAAWIAAEEGDRDAAEGFLADTGEEPFFRLVGRYHAALLAAQEGDWAASVAAYEEAIELVRRPTPRMALGYAAALQRLGQTEAASAAIEEAFAADPTDPTLRLAREALAEGAALALPVGSPVEGAAEAFYDVGLALAQENERQFGLFYVRLAGALRPEFDEATLLAGEIQERLDQNESAAAIYAQIPLTSPSYGEAQVRRAISLARLDREDEGLEALRRLATQSPEDPSVQFAMGDFFQRADDFEACAQAYEDGLARLEETGAQNWRAYFRLGACYERAGRWPDAEENLRRALELNPDQPDVLNYLGYSMVELGDRLEEAKELIERAVEASPDSGHIVDSLGWVLYRMGDFEGAVVRLEKAAALEPTEPVINDHLGDALWRVGRKTEARFHWSRALSFEPAEKDRIRIERKLEVGLDKVLEEEASLGPTPAADRGDEAATPARGG